MSFFVFPFRKRPQFYFTNSKNVINFFIHNFLYSRVIIIQSLISLLKLILPETLIHLILKSITAKEDCLPAGLSKDISSTTEFIKNNKAIFLLTDDEPENINFIIRTSHWQRQNDRSVVIFFKNHNKRPFTVAKVGHFKNKDLFEKEFNNVKLIHNKFKDSKLAYVPEPITLFTSKITIAYFEKVITGIPFNDYLKRSFNKKDKRNLYIDILEKCSDFLINLCCPDQLLTPHDFSHYFYSPIEYVQNIKLGEKHYSKLRELKLKINMIEKSKLYSTWMHGDFWTGSILYTSNRIGIIDWEFFSARGIPLWDLFSFVFHIGVEMNYFTDHKISQRVDQHLLYLAKYYKIDTSYIATLFQGYLLFNIQNRDTTNEKYWQSVVDNYWGNVYNEGTDGSRLL